MNDSLIGLLNSLDGIIWDDIVSSTLLEQLSLFYLFAGIEIGKKTTLQLPKNWPLFSKLPQKLAENFQQST